MDLYDIDYKLLRVEDHERLFMTTPGATILNKFDVRSHEGKKRVISGIFAATLEMQKTTSQLVPEEPGFVASCSCNFFVGDHYIGLQCPKCDVVVQDALLGSSGNIPYLSWIGFPEDVPGVLNPNPYHALSEAFKVTKQKYSLIDVCIDPRLEVPNFMKSVVREQSLGAFYRNFDRIMAVLIPTKHTNKGVTTAADELEDYVSKYRDILFTQKIPLLAKQLHALTSDGNETMARLFADPEAQDAFTAVTLLSDLEFGSRSRRREAARQTTLVDAFYAAMAYHKKNIVVRQADKYGLIRQHVISGRQHWTFRGVISPLVGPHEYDEIHLPWSLAVNLFRVHLRSSLMKPPYRLRWPQAESKIAQALQKFDPDINDLFDYYIRSRGGKIPIVWNRNPSIRRGAIQLMGCSYIKPDPTDKSIDFSDLAMKDANADADGDAMNGSLLIEADMAEDFYPLHASQRYFATNTPAVSDTIAVPKPGSLTWGSALGVFVNERPAFAHED